MFHISPRFSLPNICFFFFSPHSFTGSLVTAKVICSCEVVIAYMPGEDSEYRNFLDELLRRFNPFFFERKFQMLVIFGNNIFRLMHALEILDEDYLDYRHVSSELLSRGLLQDHIRDMHRGIHQLLRDLFTPTLFEEIRMLKRQNKWTSSTENVSARDVRIGLMRCAHRRFVYFKTTCSGNKQL